MNKLKIENGKIVLKDINDNFKISLSEAINLLSVNNFIIEVLDSDDLQIIYEDDEEIKYNIKVNVKENISSKIYEIRKSNKSKIQYVYDIKENSYLNVTKFYDVKSIKEACIINLNGINARIDYSFKTISKNKEKYDLIVNHNDKNTISNITNNGINILDGSLTFNVNGIVPNNIIDCELNQNNRIVTFNENKCQINPNLLISENDVTANHSAYIGKFSDEELFYLKSRGINEKRAINLLVKGLLITDNSKCNEIINDVTSKYWG